MKLLLVSVLFILISACQQAPKLPTPLQAGWKGQQVCEKLSENQTHSILRCTFPPGVGHEKHQHKSNFGYALSGGRMKMIDKKGERVLELKTNSYFNSQGNKSHEVLNVGNTTVIYLIVEAKK